jgi:hypothetical protein
METERIQTGLRFKPALIAKLKSKAKRNNKSFNRYVEDVLEREVADEFPHLNREDFVNNNEFLSFGKLIPEFSKEQLEADPKLAHILGI